MRLLVSDGLDLAGVSARRNGIPLASAMAIQLFCVVSVYFEEICP